MRIGLAYIDGQPVAAQFWTVENGTALIHKLAHDERHLAFSPGTLLSAALFQHVIDIDKVDEIDFGTGSERVQARMDGKDTPALSPRPVLAEPYRQLALDCTRVLLRQMRRNAA